MNERDSGPEPGRRPEFAGRSDLGPGGREAKEQEFNERMGTSPPTLRALVEQFRSGVSASEVDLAERSRTEKLADLRRRRSANEEVRLLRSLLGRYGDSDSFQDFIDSHEARELVLNIEDHLLNSVHSRFLAGARSVSQGAPYEYEGQWFDPVFAFSHTQKLIRTGSHLLSLLGAPSGPHRGLNRFLRYIKGKGL